MTPWFEADPARYQAELDAFAKQSITVAVDADARAKGVLVLNLGYPHNNTIIQLVATYPDFYPYFKPEVAAPDLVLPRHQSPLDRVLCLLGRRTSSWFVEDLLADVVAAQLPQLLKLRETGNAQALVGIEEAQADPVSDFFNHAAATDSFLLFDSAWHVDPAVQQGLLHLRVKESPSGNGLQGYIEKVTSEQGQELARWTAVSPTVGLKARTARWRRLPGAPTGNLDQLKADLGASWKWLGNEASWPSSEHVQLAALLFPEEVQYGQVADGWIGLQINVRKAKRGRDRFAQISSMRMARGGESDLAARMPFVGALRDKVVLLVGLGAIGAPVAWELARAGVGQLVLADHDIVDPATVRRWTAGATAFAANKADYLASRIGVDYPWTTVTPIDVKIGALRDLQKPSEANARLLETIERADVVIDCTAEMGVNHFLSDHARRHGRTFVLANATPGAWGGMVVRFRTAEACWMCLRHALYGTQPSIELPIADPQGELQPPGCADPTFTGAAFDLAEISMEVVRTVVGELADGSYPKAARQAAMLDARDRTGNRVLPTWTAVDVPRRECCSCNR